MRESEWVKIWPYSFSGPQVARERGTTLLSETTVVDVNRFVRQVEAVKYMSLGKN